MVIDFASCYMIRYHVLFSGFLMPLHDGVSRLGSAGVSQFVRLILSYFRQG